MKKIFLTGLVCLGIMFFSGGAKAQNYETALGFKFGGYNGISVKHFVSDVNSLEGILSFGWGGFNITGLYQWNGMAFDTQGMNWYLGLGAHLGVWDSRPHGDDYDRRGSAVLGADAIAGLEYTFEEVPINLSLDWKPGFNIIGDQYLWVGDVALGIRYTFQ